jgi:hypothetical protein
MSDLFAWFQNYLNLSKLTAVSVPGMIVAFALILVLGPIPCPQNTKSCPFCSGNLKPPAAPASSIRGYDIAATPYKITVTANNNFSANDEVTIAGASPQSGLNGTWKVVSATSKTITINKTLTGKTTETGAISQGQFVARITGATGATLNIDDTLSAGDLVTIQGLSAQPALNTTWRADSASAGSVTIATPNISGSATGSGVISNGTIAAEITHYTAKDGMTTLFFDSGFKVNSAATVSGATTNLELNGTWSIAAIGTGSATIKATPLATGTHSETGTVQLTKGGKTTADTVVVSTEKWLPSVVVPRLESYAHPPPGSSGEQDEKNLESAVATIQAQCGSLPLYIVAASRPEPSAKTGSAGSPPSTGGSANGTSGKKESPQYSDEQAVPYQPLLSDSYNCYGEFAALDGWLQARIAERQSLNTQEATDISSLSTSLASAQASGDRLVVRDLASQVELRKSALQRDLTAAKWLTQTETYIASLEAQVKTIQAQLQSQITATTTTPTPSAAGAVFQTIQQNIILFLLFSLIIGQILDPIQRGLMSFTGPRRSVFTIFNLTYGPEGHGEFRFGDRRLPPWTETGTNEPRPRPNVLYTALQSAADRRYLKDMNVYSENYAIGAGFITQNEYRVIHDDFYGQSQITSGLILPFLIFSLCLGIRYICCSAAATDGANATRFICFELISMIIGVFAGVPFGRVVKTGKRRDDHNLIIDSLSDDGSNELQGLFVLEPVS